MKYVYHFFSTDNTNDVIVYYNADVFDVFEDNMGSHSNTYNNPYGSNFTISHRDMISSTDNAKKYGSFINYDSNNNSGNTGGSSNSFDSSIFSKDNVTGLVGNLYVGITGIGTMVGLVLNSFPVELTQFIAFGLASVIIVAVFKFMK